MPKKTTLEELARMVASGFEKTATKEGTATKAELAEFHKGTHDCFKAVNERFNDVELHISSLGSDWKERFDALG
jgi:hypothetical protein